MILINHSIKNTIAISILMALIFACQKEEVKINSCPEANEILDEINADDHYLITTDGKLFSNENGNCEYILQYFDPGFASNYVNQNDQIILQDDELNIVTLTSISEDFETTPQFTELFIINESTLYRQWTDFVLQSPTYPTVQEYVELRKCILSGSCEFEDNRIDLAENKNDNPGKFLQFTAMAPSPEMVTSKSSIESTLMHADIDDEVTMAADFYIAEGFPFSIIDFENKWFEQSPGIRLVFEQNKYLSAELKYGTKPWFKQNTANQLAFPTDQWVHVKANILLKNDDSGIVKIWQDNQLIVDATGQTLPTSNSIQNSIEVGISATDQKTTLYLDNFNITIARK